MNNHEIYTINRLKHYDGLINGMIRFCCSKLEKFKNECSLYGQYELQESVICFTVYHEIGFNYTEIKMPYELLFMSDEIRQSELIKIIEGK